MRSPKKSTGGGRPPKETIAPQKVRGARSREKAWRLRRCFSRSRAGRSEREVFSLRIPSLGSRLKSGSLAHVMKLMEVAPNVSKDDDEELTTTDAWSKRLSISAGSLRSCVLSSMGRPGNAHGSGREGPRTALDERRSAWRDETKPAMELRALLARDVLFFWNSVFGASAPNPKVLNMRWY